jgi:hypothetical protein
MKNVAFAIFCTVMTCWIFWAIDKIDERRTEQRAVMSSHLYDKHQERRSNMDCVTDLECCSQYGDCDE